MRGNHPSPDSTNESCAICVRDTDCEACFVKLMARFQVPLLNQLLRRTKTREDAEDILQETFLAGYRNIAKYNPAWRFSTWIFTIAHRLAVSAGRKSSLKIVDDLSVAIDLPAETHGPLANAAQSEIRISLWAKARDILDPDAFTALWLTYIEGMGAAEVALVIDRSPNAVRLLLSRSRVQLADQLPVEWHAERSFL